MIDTEALRKKVIDLAIQGKLTEQLPSDGDAETLYVQIQEEKAKLVKEGKIKKEKPLPEITDEEIPFEIPDNWKWVRLISVCETIADIDHKMPVSQDSGIPLLSAKDINDDNSLNFENDIKYISEEDFERLRKKIQPQIEDIIFSRIGTLGKVGYVDIDKEFLVSYSCVVIRKIGMEKEYLGYCLQGSEMQRRVHSAKTGIGVPDLGMEMIKRFIIPLSPLKEQKRIIEKVEEIIKQIDIIDDLQKKYSNDLAVLKSKIIDAGIQGKLTEQLPEDGDAEDLYAQILDRKSQLIKEGKIKKEKPLPDIAADEIPFEIPKNWKWVRLIDVSTIINGDRGKNYPAKSTLSREGIPFISALNLNGVGVDDDDRLMCLSDEQYNKLGSGKLQKDDIVICIRGSLGKHGRYPFEKGAIASSLVICRPHCYENDMGGYIMKWLDSSMFPREIDKYDGGSAQPNLAAENLKKFLIPLPPIDEQRRIVEMIDSTISSMG